MLRCRFADWTRRYRVTVLTSSCALLVLSASHLMLAQNREKNRPADVSAHYTAAQKFQIEGKWADAEQEWRTALRLVPEDARAWTNLGVALNHQKKTDEAVAAWQRAIALDPRLGGPLLNLGLFYVNSGNFRGAVSPLRRLLELEPENDGGRRALVLALIGSEDFRVASRELAQLLARSPRDPVLLETAAQAFMQQKRFGEAAVVLKRRLDLGKLNSHLWAQYGDALDGSARTPEALEAYRRAVELDPESTLTRYGLGYLFWKLYRYEEAERELLEVLRRTPRDPRASFTLGDLYLTRGQPEIALPYLKVGAEFYPNEFDTRYALGRALVLTGDLQGGIEQLRAAVSLDSSIADGHYQLGRALTQAGLRDEAKQELDQARVLLDKKRAAESERHSKKLP